MNKIAGILGMALLCVWAVPAHAGDTTLEVTLSRPATGEFTAGGLVDVTVSFGVTNFSETILAFAYRETLPEGWTYVEFVESSNRDPNIAPGLGDGGQLQFAWINPPVLPYTMTYRVEAPSNEMAASVSITGQVEYRTDGAARFSNESTTTLLNNINAPVITLNPDLNVPAYLGDPWFDPGATAVDEEDGDLTDQIVFSGFVDGNTVGVYEVTYTVTDSDGLSAMATRQVRVIDPDNPPNEAGVLFTRTVPAEYVPGMDLVVRVMFRATEDPSSINALGLREAIPEEWAFGGVQSVDGQAVPSVAPENGTRDRLEFAWVDIPAFPYTFEYVLMIPVDDPGGEQTLEGAVEYRATGGGQFTGPAVSTTTGEALNRLQQIKAFLGCGMVADSRGTSGDGVVVAAVLIVLVVMGLRRRESPQH